MLLGQVVGTVVATRKEPELAGLRLLVVRELDAAFAATGKAIVAVDAVGAGDGEVVLFAAGSSARLTAATKDRPVDHVIMAIVDAVEIAGKTVFEKFPDATPA
ncbi:MAG: EutN/CcmL family microcompartment protein [Deltaproteobacteria bacterium]|nr:EutN/CcmL family microcompartment protein [Deltaproteobacteria bacterium]